MMANTFKITSLVLITLVAEGMLAQTTLGQSLTSQRARTDLLSMVNYQQLLHNLAISFSILSPAADDLQAGKYNPKKWKQH